MSKIVMLAGALYLAFFVGPVNGQECSGKELPAGTFLSDGTVAGEKEALAYFADTDPDIHSHLVSMKPEEMRKEFGKKFEWFQRIGRCRQRQKREMARQLKNEFRIKDIVSTGARTPRKEADLQGLLADQFDSELRVMNEQLRGMQQAPEEFRKEIKLLDREIAIRKANRAKVLAEQLKEFGY